MKLTEQKRQELIALANVELTEWDLNSDHYSLIEIALTSLTAEKKTVRPFGLPQITGAGCWVECECHEDGAVDFYTAPPVPVIKLPEKCSLSGLNDKYFDEAVSLAESKGWNNCIDEIKRLKGIKDK